MTPKKALIIVLILFLIVMAVFVFLYLKRSSVVSESALIKATGKTGSAADINKTASSAAELIQEKINKIIEDAERNTGQSASSQVRQEIIDTINTEVIKEEQNKTPEQKAADLKAQEERQKIIDQINNQIKQNATK